MGGGFKEYTQFTVIKISLIMIWKRIAVVRRRLTFAFMNFLQGGGQHIHPTRSCSAEAACSA